MSRRRFAPSVRAVDGYKGELYQGNHDWQVVVPDRGNQRRLTIRLSIHGLEHIARVSVTVRRADSDSTCQCTGDPTTVPLRLTVPYQSMVQLDAWTGQHGAGYVRVPTCARKVERRPLFALQKSMKYLTTKQSYK